MLGLARYAALRVDVKGWLETLWEQVFRDELLIPPSRFLYGNFVIGLFGLIVLDAGARDPQRTNLLATVLVALLVLTHVAGSLLAAFVVRVRRAVLVIQGVSLFGTTACLVGLSLWLCVHAARLSNVRYVPGIALSLFIYATLELHFFAPSAWRALRLRRLGVITGAASELALLAALVWRLAQPS